MQADLEGEPARDDRNAVWRAVSDWVVAGTFSPTWLKEPWDHPLVGYLVAVALQVLAAAVSARLTDAFPGFAFPDALTLLTIMVVALNWGVGPSLVAALVGVVLVNVVTLEPHVDWTLRHPSDLVGLAIFLMVGLAIAVVGSLAERNRRDAHRARATAEVAMQRLRAVQAVTDIALAYQDLDDLLRRFLERVTQVLAVDNTAILLLDGSSQELALHQAHGPEERLAGQVKIAVGQGIAGRIAANRQPLIVDDLRSVEVANPFLGEHLRSLMGVPLLVNGHLIGVLHVGTVSPRHFTGGDLQLLQLVADRMAMALDHARAYREEQSARAEATARANEIEALFEAVVDALFVYDAQGHIVRMNAAARAMMGLDALPDYAALGPNERVQRIDVRDASGRPIAPEESGLTRLLRGEVLTGASALDVQITTPDGRRLHVSITGAPLRDQDGRIVGAVAISRDVGERRRLERRTHDALEALLEMAHALVLAPAETAPGANGHSPVGQQLVRLTRQVLGCQRVGIVTFDPRHGVQHPVAVAGLSPEMERLWWESVEGAPVSDPEVPTDPELVARFFAGQPVVADMTRPPFDTLPNPFGVRAFLAAPLVIGGEVVGLLSLDYGGAEHDYTPGEAALAGGVAQLAALALERDRLQKEREEARARELALQETNQRMDEFLSIASHELKSPLTGIRGNIQLARRRMRRILSREDMAASDRDEALTLLDTLLEGAETQTNRQTRLIDDLLDLSRIQTGHLDMHRAPSDLRAVLQDSVEEHRLAWPARSLSLELPDTPVMVDIDADRIGQVVTNYVSNALKYSAPDRPVAVSLRVANGEATVRVRDEGPGLTPEQQQHIWDRYRRVQGVAIQDNAQGAGGGLGLGLYISRGIIEQHGGWVGVESAPSQGSTFWFTLPLEPP